MNKTMNQSQNYTDLKKKSLIDNHRKKSYCEQTNADKFYFNTVNMDSKRRMQPVRLQ